MTKQITPKTLCDNHDEIMDLANDILRTRPENYETPGDLFCAIDTFASKIMSLAVDAKDQGNRMEMRLRDYRSAIEGLGFERKK